MDKTGFFRLLSRRISSRSVRDKIQREPNEAKQLFNPRVVEIGNYEDYQYQHHRVQISRGAFAITFFTSKASEAQAPVLRAVCDIAKKYTEVTFLKVDVDEPESKEILKEYYVPQLVRYRQLGWLVFLFFAMFFLQPTFYFYKSGLIVGKLMGPASVQCKLEQLVDGFVNHKKLRQNIRENQW